MTPVDMALIVAILVIFLVICGMVYFYKYYKPKPKTKVEKPVVLNDDGLDLFYKCYQSKR